VKRLRATVEPGHLNEQVRVKNGNAFADTSHAQPLQSEGAAFGLSLAKDGNVIAELKSPYSDGNACRLESAGIHRQVGGSCA
jgi:hypothetical protein